MDVPWNLLGQRLIKPKVYLLVSVKTMRNEVSDGYMK